MRNNKEYCTDEEYIFVISFCDVGHTDCGSTQRQTMGRFTRILAYE